MDRIAENRMSDPDTGGVIYRNGRMYLVKNDQLEDIGPIPEKLEQQFQDTPPVDYEAVAAADAALMARLWPETTKG